jgi:hypothetical protein
MQLEDKANNIFLEFYSSLVLMDELHEVIRIKDLAIEMAIIHVKITKDNDCIEIIKHLKKINNDR